VGEAERNPPFKAEHDSSLFRNPPIGMSQLTKNGGFRYRFTHPTELFRNPPIGMSQLTKNGGFRYRFTHPTEPILKWY